MQPTTILTTLTALAALTTAQPTHQLHAAVEKRAHSGKLTYYTPGMGSCGVTNSNTDMIVAVSPSVFGTYPNPNNSPLCQKSITITCPNGKKIKADVKDRCAGCGVDDLDVSPAVFEVCGSLDLGTMKVDWDMN